MSKKRLTYEEASQIEWDNVEPIPCGNRVIVGQSKDGKYYYEDDTRTADHRILDAETGEELYSYYEDFYNGRR